MSCRTGRLRGERSLRDLCTGLGGMSSMGPRDARHDLSADHREAHPKGYIRHEVTAPRVAGPSGRTHVGYGFVPGGVEGCGRPPGFHVGFQVVSESQRTGATIEAMARVMWVKSMAPISSLGW